MVNDPLSDLVARIKNAYRADMSEVMVPWTKMVETVCAVLISEGYLTKSEQVERELKLVLKYDKKTPAMTDIKRVSKPGRRVYTGVKDMPRVLGGLGINILSTPRGVMSEKEAKKLKVGGEIVAQVW